MEKVSVLVPCRAGSQRVKNKNTRPFGPYENGLVELKLTQLCRARLVDEIVVSTDDPLVMEVAEKIKAREKKPIHIIERPMELAQAGSLDDFLAYVPTIMPPGITVWTHVTSPFFDSRRMDEAISLYMKKVGEGDFDSLMSVNAIQSFLWNEKGACISHDREKVKWPQTQDLPRFFEANSAWFMIGREEMIKRRDRIGDRPYFYECDAITGFDIDWPEDFENGVMLINALGATLPR